MTPIQRSEHWELHLTEDRLHDALDALERLYANAQRIFDKKPVRDWGETLAEAEGVLRSEKRLPPDPQETP